MAIQDRKGNLHQLFPRATITSPDEIRRVLLADRADSWDRYEGSLEDLVASGLFKLEELPGQPGRPKTSCRYGPDGEPTKSKALSSRPGGRSISLKSKKQAIAYVAISEEEREHRRFDQGRRLSELEVTESMDVIEHLLQSARQDIALPDHELAEKYRAKLRARIRTHEETLGFIRGGTFLQATPNLRLVHCAGEGAP